MDNKHPEPNADSDEDENTRARPQRRAPRKYPRRPPPSPWNWVKTMVKPTEILRLVLQGVLFMVILRSFSASGAHQGKPVRVIQVSYSDFIRKVKANEVADVMIDSAHISWQPHPRLPKGRSATDPPGEEVITELRTVRPADMATPYDQLQANNVNFGAPDRRSANRLVSLMLLGLYASVVIGMISRLQMGPMRLPGMGKGARGQAKPVDPHQVVKFADVAGVDEAKEELAEVVEFLKEPEKFTRLGARPPTGVLLVGAPGCGKTMLAKAVAGEADVPFFSVSASEFVELYVGMGASRVREVFQRARSQAPSIVFIDEIDAVAKGRGDGKMRPVGNDEREQTLNQLLTELDGFDSSAGTVICLAATNRPDTLDSALRRPGRFDRIVSVEAPDRQGRMEILKVHVDNRGLPLAKDVSLSQVASRTTGFSGAELANLVNEAALMGGRSKAAEVGMDHFEAAIMRQVAGIEKKRSLLGDTDRVVVAKHEAGHAVVGTAVAALVASCPQVEQLSIVARSGGALGFTYFPPAEEQVLLYTDEVAGRLATLLGGRAAEEVLCGRISSGASDDINRATALAFKAVAEFGLSERFGPISLQALSTGGGEGGYVFKGDGGAVVEAAEQEVKELVSRALVVAKDTVRHNRAVVESLTKALLAEERLEGPKLYNMLAKVHPPPSLTDFATSHMYIRSSNNALPFPESVKRSLGRAEGFPK
eukprot:CAMPEP_0118928456 /NCGR_PEP_ID=MMETSP1169-20130426/5702_1 /TAXON_ID=36882 /ORGANISM="Pyramimonas obovata, Strain CCMP722" /LENGTH=708 /DNA_ID=CAMNT_0006870431 /DNA_START=628 /DNA_END=2754 /DNA_ORIENTATION=-